MTCFVKYLLSLCWMWSRQRLLLSTYLSNETLYEINVAQYFYRVKNIMEIISKLFIDTRKAQLCVIKFKLACIGFSELL